MYFKPFPLGTEKLNADTLKADKQACRKIGPCGVGEKALYLNSFYIDRNYYVPMNQVHRIYKRIAMSKGGFSGKGLFASIPYLMVEYGNGQIKQCNFRREDKVDELLAHLSRTQPQIPLLSEKAEKRLAARAAEEAKRVKPVLTAKAEALCRELGCAQNYLEQDPELAVRMSHAAKAKRVNDRTNPAYKWVALVFMLAGFGAAAWGISTLTQGNTSGIFSILLGLSAIFFFSSLQVIPTARNNKKYLTNQLETTRKDAQKRIDEYGRSFPVPARYAHPIVVARMKRIVEDGRAETAEQALELLKQDLKALNSNVQVEQEEYDEVVAIKPMFLLADYS